MLPYQIALLIIGCVLGALILFGVVPMIIFTLPIAKHLYEDQWVRKVNDNKFERGCSAPEIDWHLDMFNQGMEWRNENISQMHEVEIESLGIKLYGEYFDFGFDKCVIVLPGRAETCWYACYYGEAFVKGGYNLLAIDPRAHGKSGGDKITLGKLEGLDAINWAKFLHESFGINHVCLYGLCGGATAACVALTSLDCPSYIDSLIGDAMFLSYVTVFKRRTKMGGHMTFPVTQEFMQIIKHKSDVNPYKVSCRKLIRQVKVPSLFIGGSLDQSSTPNDLAMLYKLSGAVDKTMHLFIGARHSHLRYDCKDEYDELVSSFLRRH